MRHPQVVAYERDGRLADAIRPLVVAEKWVLREPRQAEALWRILQAGGPIVLVVKMGSSPEHDLALIQRVGWQLPDVATVAVGDLEGADVLACLAWDVGAAFALFPPLSRDLLPEIVAGLMRRAIGDTGAPSAAVAEALP